MGDEAQLRAIATYRLAKAAVALCMGGIEQC